MAALLALQIERCEVKDRHQNVDTDAVNLHEIPFELQSKFIDWGRLHKPVLTYSRTVTEYSAHLGVKLKSLANRRTRFGHQVAFADSAVSWRRAQSQPRQRLR